MSDEALRMTEYDLYTDLYNHIPRYFDDDYHTHKKLIDEIDERDIEPRFNHTLDIDSMIPDYISVT